MSKHGGKRELGASIVRLMPDRLLGRVRSAWAPGSSRWPATPTRWWA